MTPRRLASPLLALLAVFAVVAVAHARTYDVPASLGATLDSTRDETELAILLPNRIALEFDKDVHAFGGGDRRSYFLTLTTRDPCGANSCFLASFDAERGTRPVAGGGDRKVGLRGGRTGLFNPRSCGGSCAPPSIRWVSRGNTYGIQATIPDRSVEAQRRRLVAAANAAIGAGPR